MTEREFAIAEYRRDRELTRQQLRDARLGGLTAYVAKYEAELARIGARLIELGATTEGGTTNDVR